MSATEERLLSLEDVADRLQVSDQSVRRWIKAGKLAAYKPGLEWRIRPSDLEDFLETRSYPKVQAPLPSGDPQAGRRYSPTDQEIKSLVRWLSYLEHRLNEGNLAREEIAHDLDAASAFGIRKDPAQYPDEVFDKFMRLIRRALEEGKSFDALQTELVGLEAAMHRLEEVYAEAKELQT
jgi:excisionase family DNA binding protein